MAELGQSVRGGRGAGARGQRADPRSSRVRRGSGTVNPGATSPKETSVLRTPKDTPEGRATFLGELKSVTSFAAGKGDVDESMIINEFGVSPSYARRMVAVLSAYNTNDVSDSVSVNIGDDQRVMRQLDDRYDSASLPSLGSFTMTSDMRESKEEEESLEESQTPENDEAETDVEGEPVREDSTPQSSPDESDPSLDHMTAAAARAINREQDPVKKQALTDANRAKNKALRDLNTEMVQNNNPYSGGKNMSKDERRAYRRGVHDNFAQHMVMSATRPLQQGVSMQSVSNVMATMTVMFMINPKLMKGIAPNLQNKVSNEITRMRGNIKRKIDSSGFLNGAKKQLSKLRPDNELTAFDKQVAAARADDGKVALTVESGAHMLVNTGQAAYVAMREPGTTPDRMRDIQRMYMEDRKGIAEDCKDAGLNFKDVKLRASHIVAERDQYDPGFKAVFKETVCGDVRPDPMMSRDNGKDVWSGKYRIQSNHKVLDVASADPFTPRNVWSNEESIYNVGSMFAREMKQAADENRTDDLASMFAGYKVAMDNPGVFVQQDYPGNSQDKSVVALNQLQTVMIAQLQDGSSPDVVVGRTGEAIHTAMLTLNDDAQFTRVFDSVDEKKPDFYPGRVAALSDLLKSQNESNGVAVDQKGVEQETPAADDMQSVQDQRDARPQTVAEAVAQRETEQRPNAGTRQLGDRPDLVSQGWGRTQDASASSATVSEEASEAADDPKLVTGINPGSPRGRRLREMGYTVVEEKTDLATEDTERADRSSRDTDDSSSVRSSRKKETVADSPRSPRQRLLRDLAEQQSADSSSAASAAAASSDEGMRTSKTDERVISPEVAEAREKKIETKADNNTVPTTKKGLSMESGKSEPVSVRSELQSPGQRRTLETSNSDYGSKVKIDTSYDDPSSTDMVETGTGGVRQSNAKRVARREARRHIVEAVEKKETQTKRSLGNEPKKDDGSSPDFDL